MKKLLFFIFMLAFLANIKGQDYIPFPMDSTIWSVNTTKYFVHGDTVIANKHYSKVWMQTDSVDFEFDMDKAFYYAAIRNDTANQKVYGVYNKSDSVYSYDNWNQSYTDLEPIYYNCDTCELLLYNFDTRTSADTFFVYSFPFISNQQNLNFLNPAKAKRYQHLMQYKITSRYAVQDTVQGVIRTKIIPYIKDCNGTDWWLEGIGGSAGLFSTGNYCTLYGGATELLCVSERNMLLYQLDTSCYRILYKYLGGINENLISDNFSIYPNPITDNQFWIKNNSMTNASDLVVELFDIYGKKVLSSIIDNSNTSIITNNLSKGVFIYRISDKTKNVSYGKIIIL